MDVINAMDAAALREIASMVDVPSEGAIIESFDEETLGRIAALVDVPKADDILEGVEIPTAEDVVAQLDEDTLDKIASRVPVPTAAEVAGLVDTPSREDIAALVPVPTAEQVAAQVRLPTADEVAAEVDVPTADEVAALVESPTAEDVAGALIENHLDTLRDAVSAGITEAASSQSTDGDTIAAQESAPRTYEELKLMAGQWLTDFDVDQTADTPPPQFGDYFMFVGNDTFASTFPIAPGTMIKGLEWRPSFRNSTRRTFFFEPFYGYLRRSVFPVSSGTIRIALELESLVYIGPTIETVNFDESTIVIDGSNFNTSVSYRFVDLIP